MVLIIGVNLEKVKNFYTVNLSVHNGGLVTQPFKT